MYCCSYWETPTLLMALGITMAVCVAISIFAMQVRVSSMSTYMTTDVHSTQKVAGGGYFGALL